MSNDTTTRIGRRRFLTTMGAAGAATLVAPARPARAVPRGEGRLHAAGDGAARLRGAARAQRAAAGGGRDQRGGRHQVARRRADHPAPGRHPEQGRAGQLGSGAPDRSGRHRDHRTLLEPGRVLGPPGHREEQDPVPPAGHRGRQRPRGRAALHVPHAAERPRHGHPHGGEHAGDGQGRGHPDQAGGHDARGRQLRHHDGQPRGGLRGQDGLRAGAARAVQPALPRLHRGALQGEGDAARPAGDQRLLRRLQDHRGDRGQAPDRGARPGGPGQRGVLESRASSPRTASSPIISSTATTGTIRRARGPARCSTRTRSASTRSCPTTACRATR